MVPGMAVVVDPQTVSIFSIPIPITITNHLQVPPAAQIKDPTTLETTSSVTIIARKVVVGFLGETTSTSRMSLDQCVRKLTIGRSGVHPIAKDHHNRAKVRMGLGTTNSPLEAMPQNSGRETALATTASSSRGTKTVAGDSAIPARVRQLAGDLTLKIVQKVLTEVVGAKVTFLLVVMAVEATVAVGDQTIMFARIAVALRCLWNISIKVSIASLMDQSIREIVAMLGLMGMYIDC